MSDKEVKKAIVPPLIISKALKKQKPVDGPTPRPGVEPHNRPVAKKVPSSRAKGVS